MDTFYALPDSLFFQGFPIVYDPLYVAATNDVEDNYTSPDGTVSVKLVGPYQHVMSAKRSLDSCPPTLLSVQAPAPGNKWVSLFGPNYSPTPQTDHDMAVNLKGRHAEITSKGTTYSGSGIMFFAADTKSPNDWNLVLFGNKQELFQECGGGFHRNIKVDENFLFGHAIDACHRESVNLFKIIPSQNKAKFIDIPSSPNTTYRAYCYWIRMDNLNTLPNLFGNNYIIANTPNSGIDKSSREMTTLKLFDTNSMVRKLPTSVHVQSLLLQATDGKSVSIRNRTVKVLKALQQENIFNSFSSQVIINVSVSTKTIVGIAQQLNIININM